MTRIKIGRNPRFMSVEIDNLPGFHIRRLQQIAVAVFLEETQAMGIAMVLGSFLVGPLAIWLGSVRRTALIFNGGAVLVMTGLWLAPAAGIGPAVALLTLVGLSGAGYTLLMAHGRAFLPPHLVGKGVTFLNMFSIGGVGLLQFTSRPVYLSAMNGQPPAEAYSDLFLFFLIPLTIGVALYFLTPETPDD